MKVVRRWYDESFGWGDVVLETEDFVVVRFDSDPWFYHQIFKEEG